VPYELRAMAQKRAAPNMGFGNSAACIPEILPPVDVSASSPTGRCFVRSEGPSSRSSARVSGKHFDVRARAGMADHARQGFFNGSSRRENRTEPWSARVCARATRVVTTRLPERIRSSCTRALTTQKYRSS
jgi:hypothetical protein